MITSCYVIGRKGLCSEKEPAKTGVLWDAKATKLALLTLCVLPTILALLGALRQLEP